MKEEVFSLRDVSVYYGANLAVDSVNLPVYKNEITALIGPSGCGKSTILRSLNRMNDLIPGARVTGEVLYHGEDIYGPTVDPVQCAKSSAWCSRNQTLSPSPFTTTSPSAHAPSA